MSLFTRVSTEEIEGAEGTIEPPVIDPIELLEAQETLPDDMVELQQDIVALEEAEEAQELLETTLTELEANPAPAEEAVVIANESYKMACYKLGLVPSISFSSEDITTSYKLSTEGIKDVIVRIVEAIKDMLAKIVLFIKKMYVKLLVLINNDAKELELLVPQIMALEGENGGNLFMENMQDHTAIKMFSDSITQRVSGLEHVIIKSKGTFISFIKDYYTQLTTSKNLLSIKFNPDIVSSDIIGFDKLFPSTVRIDRDSDVMAGDGKYQSNRVANITGRHVGVVGLYGAVGHTFAMGSGGFVKLGLIEDIRYTRVTVFDTFDQVTTKKWMTLMQEVKAPDFKAFAAMAKSSSAGLQNMMKEYDRISNEVKTNIEKIVNMDEVKQQAANGGLRLINKLMRINSEILLDNIKSIMYNNKTVLIMGRLAIKYNKQNKMSAEFEGANTKEEIKRRYKDLSKKYHPDAGGDAESFNALKNHYDGLMAGTAA